MKRFLIVLCFIITITCFSTISYATTRHDVINALKSTYTYGGKSYTVPKKAADKCIDFLFETSLTSEQYDGLISCIYRAMDLAGQIGTTSRHKMTDEQKQMFVPIVLEAARIADIDLDEELEKSNVEIVVDENNNIDISIAESEKQNNSLSSIEPSQNTSTASVPVSSSNVVKSDGIIDSNVENNNIIPNDSSGDLNSSLEENSNLSSIDSNNLSGENLHSSSENFEKSNEKNLNQNRIQDNKTIKKKVSLSDHI